MCPNRAQTLNLTMETLLFSWLRIHSPHLEVPTHQVLASSRRRTLGEAVSTSSPLGTEELGSSPWCEEGETWPHAPQSGNLIITSPSQRWGSRPHCLHASTSCGCHQPLSYSQLPPRPPEHQQERLTLEINTCCWNVFRYHSELILSRQRTLPGQQAQRC